MKITRRHLILLLLVFLFAAPGLSALWLYSHPEWISKTTTNKGSLLNPPLLLTELPHDKKWHLIFSNPESCGESCLAQLDKLARIRLALGRRLYDVDLCLLVDSETPQPDVELKKKLQELHVEVVQMTSNTAMKLHTIYSVPKLFIANPENYLVLAYPEQTLPDDVFHDIKLLLVKGN